jgi:DNA-binding Xre family transcriptional regulator
MNLITIVRDKYGSIENMYRERIIKISKGHFYRIIHHETNPTFQTIQELSSLLDVSVEDLIQYFRNKHEDKLE